LAIDKHSGRSKIEDMQKYSIGDRESTAGNDAEVPMKADDGSGSPSYSKSTAINTSSTSTCSSSTSSSGSPKAIKQLRRSIIASSNNKINFLSQRYVHPIAEDGVQEVGQGNDFLLGTLAPALAVNDEAKSIEAESMTSAKLLLNYLVAHKNLVEDSPELLQQFEDLTKKEMLRYPGTNFRLYKLLSDAGWGDNGYQLTLFRALDEEDLSLALGILPYYFLILFIVY
jgi:hypothetical protein